MSKSEFSKNLHDFDKNPELLETTIDMGNGFAVRLIKREDGKKREPSKLTLPGTEKRLKRVSE